MLYIIIDLNIFVWSINFFYLIWRSNQVHYFLLRDSYLYIITKNKVHNMGSLLDLRLYGLHFSGECTVLLLFKYGMTICAVLFDFWSYCLIIYIHIRFINLQRQRTTYISLWSLFSRVSLVCCTMKIQFYCFCDFFIFLFNSL